MKDVKKIALVICASNFERHRNIIHATHKKLRMMGGYILYVFTNYGVYSNGKKYGHGESSIYSLLDTADIDGCIVEANIGSDELAQSIVDRMRGRNIPTVTINIHVAGTPMLELEAGGACRELIEHLITDHKCTRINLVLNEGNSIVSNLILKAYRDTLDDHNIPYDEKRITASVVSTQSGIAICNNFRRQRALTDTDAIICVHDVCAISLISELENEGLNVPEDIIVCSSNYSNNSLIFQPDITGVDRMDSVAAARACELVNELINGRDIPELSHYNGRLIKGRSCGCLNPDELASDNIKAFRSVTLNKINAGSQISSMMRFNDSLEKVSSIEQLAANVKEMLFGIGCRDFLFCINEDDIEYIASDKPDLKTGESEPFCDTMVSLSGHVDRFGDIESVKFETKDIIPIDPLAGDMVMVMPVHHRARDYGYMAFINEFIPVDVYNYRICHESIGNNIDTLHNQMILRSNIETLDRLHMTDQMTDMYNRYALMRFSEEYTDSKAYSLAILDMDGLKSINDVYGHLAGNNAICIIADSIKMAISDTDLVIRYGGDEFLVLSHNTDTDYWPLIRETVNQNANRQAVRQRLSYAIGVSLGYIISQSTNPIELTKAIDEADTAMYNDKQNRKRKRNG